MKMIFLNLWFNVKRIYNIHMKTISKRTIAAIILNLFILVSELIIVITNIPSRGFSALSYYTVLSNLLGMVAGFIFVWSAFTGFEKFKKTRPLIRYYATCMLAFTLVVVFCLLVPMAVYAGMNPSFLLIEDTAPIQHIINPVLSFISFIFLEDNSDLKKGQHLKMLYLTLLYAMILIILNIVNVVSGPYPFFQVHDYPVVYIILCLAALSGVTLLINYLILKFRGTKS